MSTLVKSQKLTPFTINNGGGFSPNMEWSIGESVSVSSFMSGGYKMNTGVLQPMSQVVTTVEEYGPIVFGNQIVIGPNPTAGRLHLKAQFAQSGNLQFKLFDVQSRLVYSHEAGFIYNTYERDILMEQWTSGIYYLKVYFKANNSISKTGIYKIIKI